MLTLKNYKGHCFRDVETVTGICVGDRCKTEYFRDHLNKAKKMP